MLVTLVILYVPWSLVQRCSPWCHLGFGLFKTDTHVLRQDSTATYFASACCVADTLHILFLILRITFQSRIAEKRGEVAPNHITSEWLSRTLNPCLCPQMYSFPSATCFRSSFFFWQNVLLSSPCCFCSMYVLLLLYCSIIVFICLFQTELLGRGSLS